MTDSTLSKNYLWCYCFIIVRNTTIMLKKILFYVMILWAGALLCFIVFFNPLRRDLLLCNKLEIGCSMSTTNDIQRQHGIFASYRSPLFFEKNILVLGSEKFISYSTSDSYSSLWNIFLTREDSNTGEISWQEDLDSLVFVSPLSHQNFNERWVSTCHYRDRWCTTQRRQSDDIVVHDSCLLVMTQNSWAKDQKILEQLWLDCLIVDLRPSERNYLTLYLRRD